MSIQEIEKSHIVSGSQGLDRKIDSSSEKMVLDILQVTQYSKPIDSSIRELASNAVDSQREKEIAIEILTGQAKVEDYYVEREGSQYEASKFDSGYYSLNHLDTKHNDVIINYEEVDDTGFSDTFSVTDYGVGIGGERLRGITKLGYSTKRNSTQTLGAFGLGQKSPLSTGVPFYTVETVHNGKRYRLNCYAYKIESDIPKFAESGEINGTFNLGTTEQAFPIYYEQTDSRNYTKISFKVKKHNRSKYRHAVREQLMYFKQTKFFYRKEGESYPQEIEFNTEVLHNSPHLLVSSNPMYQKPHIVIVKDLKSDFGVNYGAVDFAELEMEPMRGSVGFKCPIRQVVRDPNTNVETVLQEGISVTPSRESVIFDEYTKDYIKSVIGEAKSEASVLVQDSIKDSANLMEWLTNCFQVLSSGFMGHRSALRELSNLVKTSELNPKYANTDIKYTMSPEFFFSGISIKKVFTRLHDFNATTGTYKKTVERDSISSWSDIISSDIYLLDESMQRHNITKDRYLTQDSNSILTFKVLSRNELLDGLSATQKAKMGVRVNAYLDKIEAKRDKILELLIEGESIKNYSEVVVPEGYDKVVEEEEERARLKTAEEIRQLEGRIPAYTYRKVRESSWSSQYDFVSTKVEPKVKELADLATPEKPVIFGTLEHEPKMKALGNLFTDFFRMERVLLPGELAKGHHDAELPYFSLLRVSKRNLKLIKSLPNYIHIDKFMTNHKDDHFEVGTFFVPYFTADFLEEQLPSLRFLRNYSEIHNEACVAFCELEKYKENLFKGYKSLISNLRYNDAGIEFVDEAKAAAKLQVRLSKEESKTAEEVASELGVKYTSASVIDQNILYLLYDLQAYAEAIAPLLNHVTILSDSLAKLSNEQIQLIEGIVRAEQLENYELSKESLETIQTLKQNNNND
jgi:hypothetical protein